MRDGHVLADYEAVKPLRRAEPEAGGAAASVEEAAPDPDAAPGALVETGVRGRRRQKEPPRVPPLWDGHAAERILDALLGA